MATIALIAFVLCIALSFVKKINAGILGFALAFLVGTYVVGMSGSKIIAGFPTSLIFNLLGIMFLMSAATVNGTMDKLAHTMGAVAGSHVKLIPFVVYFFSLLLSMVVGGIIGGSIVAPFAMKLGKQRGVNDFITACAVVFGVQGGAMTPISANGVIAYSLCAEQGITNLWPVFFHLAVVCTICFVLSFLFGGGLKLSSENIPAEPNEHLSFDGKQKFTLAILVVFIASIAVLKTNMPLTAITCSAILMLTGACDKDKVIGKISWSVIVMLAGVSMLVNVITVAGGVNALSNFLSSMMTPATASGLSTAIGGIMSAVSSATGVVMPTFIPMAKGMAENIGGGVTANVIITGIIVGSHVVPISPLSTMGGIAMAASNEETDKNWLFRSLLICAVLSVLLSTVMGFLGFYYLFW